MTRISSNVPYSIEEQMLTAIELFHYSHKFKDKVVILNFAKTNTISETLSDLRVLLSAPIRSIILLQHNDSAQELLEHANLKGYRFNFLPIDTSTNELLRYCENCWNKAETPVLQSKYKINAKEYRSWTFEIATTLAASKYYYIQERDGLFGAGKFISYSTCIDILESLDSIKYNIDNKILAELCEFQANSNIDVGIVSGKRGHLFQEVFTHRGSGTLITGSYPNLIRPATIKDVSDIQFLLLPYIRSGALLPISDQAILEAINSFYVFTVNNAIVASARMIHYGQACEIAKFCTLPRYQRKGRARQLLIELMNVARKKKYQYVFLLSLEPAMWSFLHSLSFCEVDYSELPDEWLKSYDLNRGSKAFKFTL